MNVLKGIGLFLAALILIPLYLAFMVVFMALWLVFTITGIGPLAHCLGKRADDRLLREASEKAGVTMLTVHGGGTPHRLAVRWTRGSDASLPPVAIPNGLGATLISISRLHESLVSMGFSVLSYDRAGVGQSDPLPAGTPHGYFDADLTVQDMHEVLTHSSLGLASGAQWILIGPSMGSIVAQAYMAAHPDKVCGFLNHDGFPYPFAAKASRFYKAALVYKLYNAIVPTGVLRPFLAMAGGAFKNIASGAFSVAEVRAEMNRANFYGSLAREMYTMISCAEATRAAWGPGFDLQAMPLEKLLPLVNAQPAAYGDCKEDKAGGYTWEELPRSRWEQGGEGWHSPAATRAAIGAMLPASAAVSAPLPLPALWPRLVVRCMTSREYNFPGGTRFYDLDMKHWSAAEHNLHAYLAGDGANTGFPTHHHGNLFFATVAYSAAQTMEIAKVIAARASGSSSSSAAKTATTTAAAAAEVAVSVA